MGRSEVQCRVPMESAFAVDDVVAAALFLVGAVTNHVEFDVLLAGDHDVVGGSPRIDEVGGIVEVRIIAFDEHFQGEVVVEVAGGVLSDVEPDRVRQAVDLGRRLVFVRAS